MKKTALSAYSNIRTNGLIAIGLDEGDSLISVEITTGKDHVIRVVSVSHDGEGGR